LVSAGKLFKLDEPMPLATIAEKLKGWKVEWEEEYRGQTFTLTREVKDLELTEEMLLGTYSEDFLMVASYRGEERATPITRSSRFLFTEREGDTLLFVLEKKPVANSVANKLADILLLGPGGVVEARISHDTLKALHESNPDATKVIYFDNVDIPNVNKLALYGAALANTALYLEYLKHGKIWYVVFEDRAFNLVVGITRNCVVTVFTLVDEETFIDYVVKRVIPLVYEERAL
jgi:hypothetical protein